MDSPLKILFLAIFCLTSLTQTIAQQLNLPGLHEQIPPNLLRHANSGSRQQLVKDENKKYVRFIYLVPSDKAEKPEYKLSIANAAKHLQMWYKLQLGNNKSFNLTEPIVEVYKSSHDTNWYSTNPDADWAGVWKFWFNAVNDAFALSGGSFNDPNNFWIIYIDALPTCPMQQGGGLNGVAAMGANDLRGLIGQSWLPICDEVIPDYSPCRYVGGLGHELGHAFGLPHPPGCDDGQPVACDYSSIMFTGYLDFPNTYFSMNEKTVLNSSPFINEVSIKECNIDCTNLTKEYTFSSSIDISICEGKSYFAGGELQTTAGTYRDTFTSRLGCDSVVLTRLSILPKHEKTVDASICQGKSYFAGGALQTTAGTYRDTFTSRLGCDSVVLTRLSILPKHEKTVDVSICQGKSYFVGGALQTTAGTYRDTFTSKLGCDSVVLTRLSILSKYEKTVDVSICQGKSYFAGGAQQTAAGTYRDIFSSKHGCDSIIVTRLAVVSAFEETITVSICQGESYFVGGSLQTTSGIYTDISKSTQGCDSVVITNLEILPMYERTVEASVCEGETFFAGGDLQSEPGIYYDTLSSVQGCDSVIVTQLRRGICTGVPAAVETLLKIYPVPTNGILHIEYEKLHHEELFNSTGQHILSSQMNYIDFSNLAPGYYYLKIYFSEDEFISKRIIFKP